MGLWGPIKKAINSEFTTKPLNTIIRELIGASTDEVGATTLFGKIKSYSKDFVAVLSDTVVLTNSTVIAKVTGYSSYVTFKSCYSQVGGAVRATIEVTSSEVGDRYVEIRVNGSSRGTAKGTTGVVETYGTYSFDLYGIQPGDFIEYRAHSGNPGVTVSVRTCTLCYTMQQIPGAFTTY